MELINAAFFPLTAVDKLYSNRNSSQQFDHTLEALELPCDLRVFVNLTIDKLPQHTGTVVYFNANSCFNPFILNLV